MGELEEIEQWLQKLGWSAKSASAWALNCKDGLEREVLPGTDLRLRVGGSIKLLCDPRGQMREQGCGEVPGKGGNKPSQIHHRRGL